MSQGGVFEVGVEVVEDRVAAVGLVGADGVKGGGGGRRVEAPHVTQGGLPVAGGLVVVGDAAHHQAARDLLGGLSGAERCERNLGDLGPRDPLLGGFVVEGVGVFDGYPRVVTDLGDGGLDFRVQAHGD